MDIRKDSLSYRKGQKTVCYSAKENRQVRRISESKNDISSWMAKLTISLPHVLLSFFLPYCPFICFSFILGLLQRVGVAQCNALFEL